MGEFHLSDEFTDVAAERSFIAAAAHNPSYTALISADAFTEERETWIELTTTTQNGSISDHVAEWKTADDPPSVALHLCQLATKRRLAQAVELAAQTLYDDSPLEPMINAMESVTRELRSQRTQQNRRRLLWGSDIAAEVLKDVQMRRDTRLETKLPYMGLPTGFAPLDDILNGLDPGLFLLGGPPGIGKTTFALQIALNVARRCPVVYVSYENSPENLVLKALAAKAGLNLHDIRRGYGDIPKLADAAERWGAEASRIGIIQGSDGISIDDVAACARDAMREHDDRQCFVVVDYLQLAAKLARSLRDLPTRERVELFGSSLRQLASDLSSPILCISSQNRAAGEYSRGDGKAALDSLKESGDLEYSADVVLFLTADVQRQPPPPARRLTLTVSKNRNGDRGAMEMMFQPDLAIFRDIRKEE